MERKSPNKFKQALLFCLTNRSDSWGVIVMQLWLRASFTCMFFFALFMLLRIPYQQIIGTGYTSLFDTVGEDIGIMMFNLIFSLVAIIISFMTISKSYTSPGQREYELEKRLMEQRNET